MMKTILVLVIASVVIWSVYSPSKVSVWESQTEPKILIEKTSLEIAPTRLAQQVSNTLPEYLQDTSLKGTTIDGLYPVDEQGNLVLDEAIKNRFEYFLSTMGEFNLDDVKQMIIDDIQLNLQEPAQSQALKLFDDYIAYKFALAELEASLESPSEYELADLQYMRMRIQQLRDKRREYFNPEAVSAFFGFDEVYDDFMLTRLEIQSNHQLTSDEKQAQLDALEQTLPESIRTMRSETEKVSKVFTITEAMRKEGQSSEAIYQVNAEEFGEAAARRLQEVNENREQWESRVNEYIRKKQAILGQEDLTQDEKKLKLFALLQPFSENEQRRLSAYEMMQKE